ncbi:MAG: glycosyltransferase family 2 protein [Thermodesulfovibrionales bacterium]
MADTRKMEPAKENLPAHADFLKMGQDNFRLRELLVEQDERIRALEEKNAALSTTLSRVYGSRGWRLLKKYYDAKEYILGTDEKPALSDRAHDLLKRTAKKMLPKKIQIYLKLLIYHLFRRSGETSPPPVSAGGRPFISVIVPVYNRSAFLRQALESVMSQDYKYYEVIAVDDCSTELETQDILTEFSRTRSRLRVYFNERNSGISETMNQAIIHARGGYLALMDCDDYLPPDALSKAAEAVMQAPDKGYFFSDRINVDAEGREIEQVSFANRKKDNYLRELMKGMFTDHLKVIRKDAFQEVGLFDRRFDSAQDYDFALRYAAKHPAGFGYIRDYLYYHRIYPEQISSAGTDLQKTLAEKAKSVSRNRIALQKGLRSKSVSIIILSFNKKELTVTCVESILATVRGDYEIIIFDNNSARDTVDLLKQRFSNKKDIRLIFSDKNLGCPGGRKMAIPYATGDYIVTLDNDITVTGSWLDDLILRVEEAPDIAGACCKVLFPDNKIQFNGGRAAISDGFIEFSLIDAWKNAGDMGSMKQHDCDWIPGGATLYKRSIYEKLSICDDFRNAYEDNDFSFNVRKLGYRVVNCPTAVVIHHHVMYDKKSAFHERDYMETKYSHAGLKQSVLAFYRRHGVIIKDEYVYRVFGVNRFDNEKIQQHFSELALFWYH